MPPLLHILKIMMNVMVTLQPRVEYSTRLQILLLSTLLLFLFFSTISFPPPAFVCVHSFTHLFLCYSLQFLNRTFYIHASVISKTLKMLTTFDKKQKPFLMVTPFFFILELLAHYVHFSLAYHLLVNT